MRAFCYAPVVERTLPFIILLYLGACTSSPEGAEDVLDTGPVATDSVSDGPETADDTTSRDNSAEIDADTGDALIPSDHVEAPVDESDANAFDERDTVDSDATDPDEGDLDQADAPEADLTDADAPDVPPDRSDVDEPEIDPTPECPNRPSIDRSGPWVTIGSGEREYRDLTACQEVPIVFGIQGGIHVWAGVRAGNYDVGDELVWMDFTLTYEDEVIGAATYPDNLEEIDGQLEYSRAAVVFYLRPELVPSGLMKLEVHLHNDPGTEYPEFAARDYAYISPCICDAEEGEPPCLDEDSPFYVAPENPEDELCPGD